MREKTIIKKAKARKIYLLRKIQKMFTELEKYKKEVVKLDEKIKGLEK